MATINRPDLGARNPLTVTISGTSGTRYVVGAPLDATAYNGKCQGRYILESTGAYRWVCDEPTTSAAVLTYAYDDKAL